MNGIYWRKSASYGTTIGVSLFDSNDKNIDNCVQNIRFDLNINSGDVITHGFEYDHNIFKLTLENQGTVSRVKNMVNEKSYVGLVDGPSIEGLSTSPKVYIIHSI